MPRITADELLAEARRGLRRLEPAAALVAQRSGALLVDVRSEDERRREGVIPGSLHLPHSVLPWRVDPGSAYRNPAVGGLDAELVLLCTDGWSSSLAAATVGRLGFARAADVVGGFRAWAAAGLPVRRQPAPRRSPLLGMEPPEPGASAVRVDDPLEDAATLYDAAADELDRAAAHCRTAARHFRDREIPRGAAHAWAARGHVLAAEESLDAQARTHAERSVP
jgi:rhodanese-related sulfurtransferase